MSKYKYQVTIRETFDYTIVVDAASAQEAEQTAYSLWSEEPDWAQDSRSVTIGPTVLLAENDE